LILVGCNSNEVVIGGKERTKQYSTVVSLAPSATDFLLVRFQAANVLKGVTDVDDSPLVKDKIRVVKNTKLDAEALTALKPDLIVYDSQLWTEQALAPAKATGAEMVDINVQSLDAYIEKSYELAKKFGNELSASEYLDVIDSARSSVRGNLGTLAKPKVTLLLVSNGYMVAGSKSMAADLIRNAQGEFIGPDSVRYETVNVEWLLQNQPDIIFVLGEGADKVLADPRLAPVSAVKTQNVFNINETQMSRYTAIDRLITSIGSRVVEWAKKNQGN
jgi:ABC-type Fe3+-hydroxamate transport system substrate-binding protein